MEHEQAQRIPADRRAALEELERFGRDIERYRAQRKALGDEFEAFINSFDAAPDGPGRVDAKPAPPRDAANVTPAAAVPSPATAAAAPAALPVAAAMPIAPSVDAPVEPKGPTTPTVNESTVSAAVPPDAVITADATPRPESAAPAGRARPRVLSPVLLGAALVVVFGAGLLLTKFNSQAPEPASRAPVAAAPDAPAAAPGIASPAAAAPAPAVASPPTPAAAATGESELTTIRRVWMRVIVDGARVVEREVPAGTRLPLKAEKTIVIRTGDAGAVRLSLRGQPGAFLGAEGEVVTRSFAVPPRPPAPVR